MRIFQQVSLSLPIDRSADHELDIKGFGEIEIGDWCFDLATPDQCRRGE